MHFFPMDWQIIIVNGVKYITPKNYQSKHILLKWYLLKCKMSKHISLYLCLGRELIFLINTTTELKERWVARRPKKVFLALFIYTYIFKIWIKILGSRFFHVIYWLPKWRKITRSLGYNVNSISSTHLVYYYMNKIS